MIDSVGFRVWRFSAAWMLRSVVAAEFVFSGGCSGPESPARAEALLPAVYTDSTAQFPLLRFTDGSVSLNDRCPVRKVKLNRRLPPLFVNGRPVGFC